MTVIKNLPLLICVWGMTFGHTQSQSFTKAQIKEDLEFLKKQLVKKHPNRLAYTSESDYQKFFKEIKIPKTTNTMEAYQIMSSITTILKDGHTLIYPSKEIRKQNTTSGHFFPFEIFWNGQHLYITKNYSSDTELKAGTKILAINGKVANEIVAQLLHGMMQDGNNNNYPVWVLNNYFFEYYSYFFGCPKNFRLSVEQMDGTRKDAMVQGLLKPTLLHKINQQEDKKAIMVEFDKTESIATLTIKSWHNQLLKKQYNQRFKKEIIGIMDQIKKKGVTHLLIDVRNNQGGDVKNATFFLSYLLDSPFEVVQGYKKIKRGCLATCTGPQKGIHQTKSNAFSGAIYVLINGGSFSNTGIFCSALQKYNRATFIGEETGGSAYLISGNPKTLTLPNTKIQVVIPRLQFRLRKSKNTELGGVKPDYEVQSTIQRLLEGKDMEKELALQLISNSK